MTEVGGYIGIVEEASVPEEQAVTVTENRAKTISESLYAKGSEVHKISLNETNCIIISHGQLTELDTQLKEDALSETGLDNKYKYSVTINDPNSQDGELPENKKVIRETWGLIPIRGENGIETLPAHVRWYLAQAIIQDIDNTRTLIIGHQASISRLEKNTKMDSVRRGRRIRENEAEIRQAEDFLPLQLIPARILFGHTIDSQPWFNTEYAAKWHEAQGKVNTPELEVA